MKSTTPQTTRLEYWGLYPNYKQP